jgi:uncharacterized protein YecT (DUF1311 family)
MKAKATRLIAFGLMLIAQGVLAQVTDRIDMENIRKQPYLKHSFKINCDSTEGTTVESRICANLELQRQDSLLQSDLKLLTRKLQESGDTIMLRKLALTQDLWERYRYSHCASLTDGHSSHGMILFMTCAAGLTARRREDLKYVGDY